MSHLGQSSFLNPQAVSGAPGQQQWASAGLESPGSNALSHVHLHFGREELWKLTPPLVQSANSMEGQRELYSRSSGDYGVAQTGQAFIFLFCPLLRAARSLLVTTGITQGRGQKELL